MYRKIIAPVRPRTSPVAAALLFLCAAFTFGGVGSTARAPSPALADACPGVNGAVLYRAFEFENGGGYDATWKSHGVPETVRFRDETILTKSDVGTYCSGFTFAVVMRAAQDLGLLKNHNVDSVRMFQRCWFGATDVADEKERQCVAAVEKLEVGAAVGFDDARPGDFVQFWRRTSGHSNGHSAVFLGWTRDNDDAIVGLRYRSSQSSTGGIGDREERFGSSGDDVRRSRTYFCRLSTPG